MQQRFKRVLLFIILPVIVVMLVVAWQYTGYLSFMPIKKVIIKSDYQYVKKQQIQSLLLPLMKDDFLHFKLEDAHNVMATLPGVKSVSIRRVWPSTLAITLKEHHAIANWENKALIDGGGQTFVVPSALLPKGLPLLMGNIKQQKQMLGFLQQITSLVAPYHLAVAILVLDDHGAWHVKFTQGLWLHLGVDVPYQKLSKFLSIYADIKMRYPTKKLHYADMNYPNAVALKWQAA